MNDHAHDVIAQQINLYGEPLGTRFGRLLQAFAIPQSRLASVIGLSAPMLSQLATGQRVKISNPAVYARLLRLEELAPSAAAGDPASRGRALDEVAASRPQLSTGSTSAAELGSSTLAPLARAGSAAELRAAARAVAGTALAALLEDAAAVADADGRR